MTNKVTTMNARNIENLRVSGSTPFPAFLRRLKKFTSCSAKRFIYHLVNGSITTRRLSLNWEKPCFSTCPEGRCPSFGGYLNRHLKSRQKKHVTPHIYTAFKPVNTTCCRRCAALAPHDVVSEKKLLLWIFFVHLPVAFRLLTGLACFPRQYPSIQSWHKGRQVPIFSYL